MKTLIKKSINKVFKPMGFEVVGTRASYVRSYWLKQQYLEKSEFKYILWLDRVYQKIAQVPGHIVELGVAYGRNAIIFKHFIQMHNDDSVRQYYGFDTFDGYNEQTLVQDKHLSPRAWKDIDVDLVQDRIAMAAGTENIHLVKGDILKTVPVFLEKNPNFRAALLYVDCNAYTPAIEGMERFKDHMSPGGVICIDEKKQGGETKALIEFCKKHDLRFMKDSTPFSIPAYTCMG